MKGIDIVAIIGALAWLPKIFEILRKWLIRSKISIIIQRFSEIGFTSLGPIFNIRLAFSVINKDIVIKNIQIIIKHDTGEERIFSWQGIIQSLGKLSGPDGQSIPYEKENTVLAIKLQTKDIDERLIRFQENIFIQKRQELINKFTKKMIYLKNQQDFNSDKLINSEEFNDLCVFIKQCYWWKIGKYTVTIKVESNDKFYIDGNIFYFELNQMDIQNLDKNLDQIKDSFINELKHGDETYKQIPIQWNWINTGFF
jgi:hypothetical protein